MRWPRSSASEAGESGRRLRRGRSDAGGSRHTTVAALLRSLGYSLQSNRKALEGAQHPDRDAQFRFINERVAAAITAGRPAISIDTKKKELVGEFANRGREWRPGGEPIKVLTHDFPTKTTGKAIPYGVYDIAANEGFVNVGITAETAQLAVASIKAWWEDLGRERYAGAGALQITADCGGGNGNRVRLWKTELQRLADQTGLTIGVCHFPPGTSKWNKIEHRLFCHISHSWRGRPLASYEIVINSIAATTTSTGLKVYARLDEREYPKKVQVTDEQLAAINLTPDPFHPEWNYSIAPQPATPQSQNQQVNYLRLHSQRPCDGELIAIVAASFGLQAWGFTPEPEYRARCCTASRAHPVCFACLTPLASTSPMPPNASRSLFASSVRCSSHSPFSRSAHA